MLLVLCLLASFAMQIWLLAKLASKSDQAPNTDVGQTMLASFARPLHDNKRYTMLKESNQSFHSTKNSLIINLKGKLQKPFNVRRSIFGLLACWLKYHVVLAAKELVNSTAIIDHSNMVKPYMEVLIL